MAIGHRTVGEHTASEDHSTDLDLINVLLLRYTNNDIVSAPYLNNYSSHNYLLSMSALYPLHCLASHEFSHTHWLLAAALQFYNFFERQFPQMAFCVSPLLICVCPVAEIMLCSETERWIGVNDRVWHLLPEKSQTNTLHCQSATLCPQHWPHCCCWELESLS